ncbi:hypothetical protein DMUE_1720 [Dictyocoela muelleri]|nr:hypothetical protein DMUE_1720 [Dictyocoela muelleri]
MSILHYSDNNFIYLYECGFNRHTSAHYGYSPVNKKSVVHVNGNIGLNMRLLCIISYNEKLAYFIHKGPINSRILVDFLDNELFNVSNNAPRKSMIMDNKKFVSGLFFARREKTNLYKKLKKHGPHRRI